MTDFATDQSVLDFYQEPHKPEKLAIDEALYKAIQSADDWALRDNKVYAVVDMGHRNYQIWPKSQVGKDYNMVYDTEELNN